MWRNNMAKRPRWTLDLLKKLWPLADIGAKLIHTPIIGKILSAIALPFFSKNNFNITYIPINKNIDGAESTILPSSILESLIKQSSNRVIIKRCHCRDAKQCKEFPISDSCLLLGADTKDIDPRVANHVSVDEALKHANKQVELGLLPMTGRVRMDDFFYGVPNGGKMLSICFCCTCCCSVLGLIKNLPHEAVSSIVPLRGIKVEIDHNICKKCETCISHCFIDARSFDNSKIIINQDLCKGCGRCAEVCPEKAVTISIENTSSAIDELMDRIKKRINIT